MMSGQITFIWQAQKGVNSLSELYENHSIGLKKNSEIDYNKIVAFQSLPSQQNTPP